MEKETALHIKKKQTKFGSLEILAGQQAVLCDSPTIGVACWYVEITV